MSANILPHKWFMRLCVSWRNSYPCLLVLLPTTLNVMWLFLYKTAITSVQNSQGGNSRNVTTLDWAKLAKRWQALSLSDKQTNRHQGLTYTSPSSLGEANADVRLGKLARHQNPLWYRKWGCSASDHKASWSYNVSFFCQMVSTREVFFSTIMGD